MIAPDFSVHALDPNAITEAPAREGDYETYSDGKRVRGPFPAIAPGVVVEEEYDENETQPFFSPRRVGEITFGHERVPVAHSRLAFDAPASLPLQFGNLLLPDRGAVWRARNCDCRLRKLKRPKEALEIPDSTYMLAQMRLKAMNADGGAACK